MDRRGRKIESTKLFGHGQLLRRKGLRKQNFSVRNLSFDALAGRKPRDFQLRKFLVQLLRKPIGRKPQIKTVISGDEEFRRRGISSLGHRTIRWFSNEDRFRSFLPVRVAPTYLKWSAKCRAEIRRA